MKKHLVLSALLILSLLVFLPVVSGCSTVRQQTTATLGGTGTDAPDEAAAAADAAIAELTQSDDIETPATIEAGVLQAGCDAASPPLEYLAIVERVEGDKVIKAVKAVGFEVDLCTAIAKKMGLELKVVQTRWNDLVPSLESGQFDIVMSAMVATPDLLEQYSATDPHLAADLAISTSVDDPLADEDALKGKIVAVQIDTVAQAVMEGIEGVKEIRTYPQILGAFQDLAAGRLDAVVADEPASLWILDSDPDYKDKYAVSGRIETDGGYAFWCKKDSDALLAAMNAALEELRAQGVYQKICAKWGLTGS